MDAGEHRDEEEVELVLDFDGLGRSMQECVISRYRGDAVPGARVHDSHISGKGLFTTRAFRRGELVLELFGGLLDRQVGPSGDSDYVFGLNARFQIEPRFPLGPEWEANPHRVAWAINHSCRPSVAALRTSYTKLGFSAQEGRALRQRICHEDGTPEAGSTDAGAAGSDGQDDPALDVVFFVALQDIAEGEEVFFDYRRASARDPGGPARACLCGAEGCRGRF
jgi:hypothetical protein